MSGMNHPIITAGMRLAIARRKAAISAKHIARKSGYSEKSISRFENDREPIPPALLYVYQEECEVPMSWLRGEEALTQEVVSIRWEQQLPFQGPYRAA